MGNPLIPLPRINHAVVTGNILYKYSWYLCLMVRKHNLNDILQNNLLLILLHLAKLHLSLTGLFFFLHS